MQQLVHTRLRERGREGKLDAIHHRGRARGREREREAGQRMRKRLVSWVLLGRALARSAVYTRDIGTRELALGYLDRLREGERASV